MSKDRIFIKGIAVKEGISRNYRKYIPEELHKFAPTMIGKPILKDHEGYTDNVIGKVIESNSIDDGKLVEYRGWIKEDGSGIIEKIKDGRISEVSIGAIAKKVVKEKKSDDFVIPIDMEALELSTTPVPGNRGTSIGFEKTKYSEKQLREIITNYEEENMKEENQESQSLSNDNFNIENKKEDTMEAENTKSTNEVEKVNTEAIEKAEALEKELKVAKEALEESKKEKAAVEESRRQDAIGRYKEKANAKDLKVKDLSKSSMEMIQFAIEMADEAEEPATEEPEKEEPEAEPEAEAPKPEAEEEPKPEAQPESEEAEEEETVEDKFEGYILERAEGGTGYAFYKHY